MLAMTWRKGNSCIVGGDTDWHSHSGKHCVFIELPQKIENGTALWPSNSTPGNTSEKNPKTLIQKNICTPIFIAELFTIAEIWKQPKSPLTDEWIKKLWYVYTIKYYSSIKKEILPYEQYGWT